jgi:hypothetical protein
MQGIKTIQIVLGYFILLSAATGQEGPLRPTGNALLLYRLAGSRTGWVLSLAYDQPDNDKVSILAIGDSFSIQPSGPFSSVVMSNVYVLQTRIDHAPSNHVVQSDFKIDAYR